MLFEELINEKEPAVKEAVDEVINTALENQSHPQDVLLVIKHSFFINSISESLRGNHNISDFAFGPTDIGISENTHSKFFEWYFKNHIVNKEKFLIEIKHDNELKEVEDISVNIEKSIYVKFWEADMIVKYFYQLSLLCQGKNYDWYFNVPKHSREGSKQDIIRLEIRDQLKTICPKFYNLIKETYSTQLRNAIAHSQYFIRSRNIKYLNYSKDPKAFSGIESLSFDEWANYSHNTILIYISLINRFTEIKELYYQKTVKDEFLEIRIAQTKDKLLFSKIYLRNDYHEWTTFKKKEQ